MNMEVTYCECGRIKKRMAKRCIDCAATYTIQERIRKHGKPQKPTNILRDIYLGKVGRSEHRRSVRGR